MSRSVQVAACDALDIAIPEKSVRFYSIYNDCVFVDKRCLRRYARRARNAYRGSKSLPKELKDYLIRRYRRLERRV